MKTECQNCGKAWNVDDLLPIRDIYERVAAGEPMPAGECPDCGALCQPVEEQPAMAPALSSDAYAAEGGVRCPSCGSDQLEGGSVEIDTGIAWQPVTCLGCEAEWNDLYVLTGFDG